MGRRASVIDCESGGCGFESRHRTWCGVAQQAEHQYRYPPTYPSGPTSVSCGSKTIGYLALDVNTPDRHPLSAAPTTSSRRVEESRLSRWFESTHAHLAHWPHA